MNFQESESDPHFNVALFNLGFRPFFLGASVYSIIVALLWMAIYSFNVSFPMAGISSFQWHAHEMIFGYAMAVIAGFLLTAVKNWTGVQTAHGHFLAAMFFFWLIARVLFLFGSTFISIAAFFDLLFNISIFVATVWPVIQSRSWRHMMLLSKLLLLALANLFFYLGYLGILEQGVYWGIYGGLYLVISFILMISKKVMPFFIERGVGYPVQLYDPKWITILGLLLFLVFFISEVFLQNERITGYTAIGLFIVYSIRLIGWHTTGIWKKPLLWGLYLAMVFIVTGFLLFALSGFANVSNYIAIHAFAYGGIGMMTVGMMARISLGHTGRNVNAPPAIVKFVLLILLFGAIFRVFLPMFDPSHYLIWMILSQVLWVIAFLLFVITYAPILIRSRIDGQAG